MFVCVAASGDGAGMEARLVGEGLGPHVGLLGVGSEVDDLGDVVGHRGEPVEVTLGKCLHAHLETEVGDYGHQVAVSDPLAIAVYRPLNLSSPGGYSGQGVGYPTAGVVVKVDAYRGL